MLLLLLHTSLCNRSITSFPHVTNTQLPQKAGSLVKCQMVSHGCQSKHHVCSAMNVQDCLNVSQCLP